MKSMTLKQKYSDLQELLSHLESIAVAFSGGVDSSLLLKVATDTLGKKVIAITADSLTCSTKDRQDAVEFAKELGVDHIVVNSDEISLPEFVSNPRHRCYVCKHHRYSILMRIAHENGMAYVVDGENVDDASDFRPGSLAAKELGVVSPLRNAGFTKADIRALAKELGLKCWNKPAYACLATRIPYGSHIDESKLEQIDKAEAFLRDVLGCDQIRVTASW